jgi:DNA ligase D-like protein (predicted 3'-phosphoesterase)
MAVSRRTKSPSRAKTATRTKSTKAAATKNRLREEAPVATTGKKGSQVTRSSAAKPTSAAKATSTAQRAAKATSTAKRAAKSTTAERAPKSTTATRGSKSTGTKHVSKSTGTRRVSKATGAAKTTDASNAAKAANAAKAQTRARITIREPADKLAKYRSKRDFGRTPEPEGQRTGAWKKTGNPYFVIQKHAASRLHYDFRLEVDGVLKSWAVPKGPSMDPQVKRLAVEVEDHPVEYADFEGIIPKGEYGGGTVIVWDAGPYRNLKFKEGKEVPLDACHKNGQIEIWLEGKKIRGGFALVHTRMAEQGNNWLLIKMKDKNAGAGDPVSERVESVLSGRTIEEVAGKPERVWSSR